MNLKAQTWGFGTKGKSSYFQADTVLSDRPSFGVKKKKTREIAARNFRWITIGLDEKEENGGKILQKESEWSNHLKNEKGIQRVKKKKGPRTSTMSKGGLAFRHSEDSKSL